MDYIKELQQLLQSLEAKKQRRAYTEQLVLSPRPPACCSPRPPLSPRLPLPLKSTPPMSPRPAVPISPRTPPTPNSPYKLCRQPSLPLPLPLPLPPPPSSAYASPALTPTSQESSAASSYLPSLDAIATELCAYTTDNNSKQQAGGAGLPEVKVEFSGANLVVKTVSQRAPGQAVKVIAALEGRALEILHAKISTVDDTAVNSFTIKVCTIPSPLFCPVHRTPVLAYSALIELNSKISRYTWGLTLLWTLRRTHYSMEHYY